MNTIRLAVAAMWLASLGACGSVDEVADNAPDAGQQDSADAGVQADTDAATSDSPLNLPDTPFNYAAIDLPAHFETGAVRAQDNTPGDNPTTDRGATLGRVLFYDTQLSANGTISCASCHAMTDAFTDTAQFSLGFDGGTTGRNSMSLVNSRWYANGRFFWDERADSLEDQVLMPIQDSVEMGLTLEELVSRVDEQAFYGPLFQDAFGDSEVTSERISRALAQFVRAMVSYRSRYDDGLVQVNGNPNAPFPNFTAEENQGKALFFSPQTNCAACHVNNPPPAPGQPPANLAVFYVNIATNNGLDVDLNVSDNGIGDRTGLAQDMGKFKSPSLRNVALTAPYMHDGRLATLRNVVEHYNDGVQAHPNLDGRLRNPDGTPRRLNLTPAQIDALVAFMRTLTDTSFVSDVKFSDPFVK